MQQAYSFSTNGKFFRSEQKLNSANESKETVSDDRKMGSSSIRWALVSLALSMLLSSLGVSIPNVALPALAHSFGAPFQQVQWVVLSYLLAITVMIVSAGRLGDIIDRRRVLLAGIFVFTIASIFCAIAPTLSSLIAARILQGCGAAVLMALTVAMVRETVTKEKTGSAMGLLGTMSAIGTALGPSLGGFLIAGPGWRAIFIIMVPLGIINLVLGYRYLPAQPKRPASKRKSFDIVGTVLLGASLALYSFAVTAGHGQISNYNYALLLAAVVGIVLFALAEKLVQSPLIDLAALRNAKLAASLMMTALVSTVMMATLVVGPFYLSRSLGLGGALVGLVMAVGPVISSLSGVPAGRIVDRMGAPSVIAFGLFEMALGALALAILPQILGVPGYVVALAILTPGYQLFQAANNTAVMIDVPQDRRGVISGMLSLARNLGLITGASAMGAVFAFASGGGDVAVASPAAVAAGMRTTFVTAAILMVVALVIAAASRRGMARQAATESGVQG
jgi:EmrB/QacA subfamily drug resistance transporter